jgi:hypothetical protein
MQILYLAILIWISMGISCAILAHIKEESPVLWFFRGLAFGVFALIKLASEDGD